MRIKNRLMGFLAFLVFLIAFLHVGALFFDWYIEFWWWDIMNHFLGGFFIGVLFLWIFVFSGIFSQNLKQKGGFYLVVMATIVSFIVAVGWEFYEYLLGFDYSPEGYLNDTFKDITMGFLGALVGSVFFVIKKFHISYE